MIASFIINYPNGMFHPNPLADHGGSYLARNQARCRHTFCQQLVGYQLVGKSSRLRGGENHRPRLGYLGSAQLVSEAPNALVAPLESVVGDQILPDGHGIAISTESQRDDFPVGFTGARRA